MRENWIHYVDKWLQQNPGTIHKMGRKKQSSARKVAVKKKASIPVAKAVSGSRGLPRTLEGCRKQIDSIDSRIIELLDQRARVARRVGQIKDRAGRPMFDAGRHIQKLNRMAQRGAGEFPSDGLRLVFGEIMSACLSLEAHQMIGFLGPVATFSHIAASRAFGRSVSYEPMGSIREIFEAVEKEWIQFGIVPIENSTGGVIHTTLDELMNSTLAICAEIHTPIHHNLMSRAKSMAGIRKVCTHPQILSQCREWLQKNLPKVAQIEVASSGEGVKLALKNKTIAAIGPDLASKINNLPIMKKRIEDRKDNITRFLIIGHQSPAPSGHDKTSIMFSIKDEPGGLKRLLAPFSDRGINLTKIESRPSRRRAWDYIFFVDLLGHMDDKPVIEALEKMKPYTTFVRILGSYPLDKRHTAHF
jgi:chorismate mutase/prephenate dehydratase